MNQLKLNLEKPKTKDAPKDFVSYMRWLDKLEKTNPEAYEREFGKDYFDEET